MFLKSLLLFATSSFALGFPAAPLVYEGGEGPGKGKHIVFIANDHEYRSEETCPLMARILAKHHGFKCTVLFGMDHLGNIQAGGAAIPNMEVLKEADRLFMFTRFMVLPDEQADLLVDYFERGGPAVALRTTTHSFNGQKGKWAKLNFNHKGDDYLGGLGEQIFGNTWHPSRGQGHYGQNHSKGSRLSAAEGGDAHAIMTGVIPFHAYSGAYLSRLPEGGESLLKVEVLDTFEPSDQLMEGKEAVVAAWTRSHYVAPSGAKKEARVVYGSFGASEDLKDESARRFLVNASYWALGLEAQIKADSEVGFVGGYSPSPYATGLLFRENVQPAMLVGWEGSVMPLDATFGGIKATGKKAGQLYKVLSPRPAVVELIKKSEPDFDLESFKPKKKDKK